ncbi:MAG TPA: serine/threonine-protein kinase [Polyangiales bacterium]|nr:serine/threonine-protein kinase [Polyangiales bacterium]
MDSQGLLGELGAARVARGNDDKAAPSGLDKGSRAEPRASTLWPSAGDSSSGLRDKRAVAGTPKEGVPRVGPFELLSPIGSTAYGRAFRARRQEREVALHFLVLDDDGEGTLASALPLAVARCAQLSHPNVIAVEQQGRNEEDGAYYLVTELLDGVSLAAALDDADAFPLTRALKIALQIARALRAAHKLGIAHGALSPANVRVSQVLGGELVRVVGFDCAALSPHSPALTGPYQAPERGKGRTPDTRGDIFALGALVYRMLVGEPPTVEAGLRAPSLSNVSREPVPRALDELIARCLEPDPSLRQSDLTSLMRGLREVARELNLAGLDDRMTPLGAPSLPPIDTLDPDSSGALFAAEASSKRGSAAWVIAGLMLALAAVWLVWEASTRVRPEVQRKSAEPRRDDP